MQSKPGIFVAFTSQSQTLRDKIKFEDISLEKQKRKRTSPNLGKRAQAIGPICKSSYALLPGLREMVS